MLAGLLFSPPGRLLFPCLDPASSLSASQRCSFLTHSAGATESWAWAGGAQNLAPMSVEAAMSQARLTSSFQRQPTQCREALAVATDRLLPSLAEHKDAH